MEAEPNVVFDEAEIERLCGLAAGGDADAMERLLWGHHGRLLSYAKRKIGVDWQGKIDAEDILQEAYFDLFSGVSRFVYGGPESFYHWATRVIEHRFIDCVRGLRRQKRDVGREVRAGGSTAHNGLLEQCMREMPTPSGVMRRQDAIAALMMCMAKLPEDQRKAVQMMYLDEMPAAEVAGVMERTEDAVRRLASRGVEKLKLCLGRATRYLSRAP